MNHDDRIHISCVWITDGVSFQLDMHASAHNAAGMMPSLISATHHLLFFLICNPVLELAGKDTTLSKSSIMTGTEGPASENL